MLSVCLLTLTMVVGGAQFYGSHEVGKNFDNVSNVQLPAVKDMAMVDMMHDGLRAVVYKALFAGERNDIEEKKEVAEELKEFSQVIRENMEAIEKLDVHAETKAAIEDSKVELDQYVKNSEIITALALSGRTALAIEKLPEFGVAFKNLESKLEKLGEMIETDANEAREAGAQVNSFFNKLSMGLLAFSLIFGVVLSALIIRDLMKTLTSVISRLSGSSREVSAASSTSASSATELSEAATEQAAGLQETMASIEEISAMVSQNAESANKVKGVVDTNLKASNEGTTSVNEMLQAIGEIKSTNDEILGQMERSNKEFAEIVKIIGDIGEKTRVIDDIVFQTKLLSFNASVEAARAGEHGKGFAVVAEEVGNLAQMSGNAAKQITDLLSGSIKKVNEIVEQTTQRVDALVEIGKDKISLGQSTAQKCRAALDKITENANTVASMVTEITEASREQAQGVQEINKAISQLDQVTQQNATLAQQSSTQAENLNTESTALAQAVHTLAVFVGSADTSGDHNEHHYGDNVSDINEKNNRHAA